MSEPITVNPTGPVSGRCSQPWPSDGQARAGLAASLPYTTGHDALFTLASIGYEFSIATLAAATSRVPTIEILAHSVQKMVATIDDDQTYSVEHGLDSTV